MSYYPTTAINIMNSQSHSPLIVGDENKENAIASSRYPGTGSTVEAVLGCQGSERR
jgi:hypothetical protein